MRSGQGIPVGRLNSLTLLNPCNSAGWGRNNCTIGHFWFQRIGSIPKKYFFLGGSLPVFT